jgi:hypothetical protein
MPGRTPDVRGLATRAGAAALLCAAALPATSATPVQRVFSDWTVTCDNGLRCMAMAGAENGGRLLAIERDAGPGAVPTIELAGAGVDFVDATALRFPAPQWLHQEDGGFQARSTRDLAAAQRFIDAIRNGSRLHAAGDGEDAPISLRGLSAALLFIDDAQGRLGTRGALLRRGDAPETKVPAAPTLPVLRAAPAPRPLAPADADRLVAAVRQQQAAALAKEECDDDAPRSDQAWALTDTDALVHLGCWMGAYQGSGLLFRVPRVQPAPAVRIALPSVPGEPPITTPTSAEYDPATGELHHYAKGRGLGDCGQLAHWVFDGGDFVLAQYTSMEQCTGVHSDHWPTRWRSRTPTAGVAR